MVDGHDHGFALRKAECLKDLRAVYNDKSRKGSLDAPIEELVWELNSQENYYTTSSCSGRIAVFQEPNEETEQRGRKAGGGEW